MNTVPSILSVSALALVLASEAAYAGADRTRAEVQAELVAAQKDGEIATSFVGKAPREFFPGNYNVASGAMTREQVRAELVEAQRNGDIIVGDQGVSPRDLFPAQYPSISAGPGKTREQVQAELGVAQRNGDIVVSFVARPERELLGGSFENPGAADSQLYASSPASGKTRAQVYAELVAAKSAGELRTGDDGLSDRERFP